MSIHLGTVQELAINAMIVIGYGKWAVGMHSTNKWMTVICAFKKKLKPQSSSPRILGTESLSRLALCETHKMANRVMN